MTGSGSVEPVDLQRPRMLTVGPFEVGVVDSGVDHTDEPPIVLLPGTGGSTKRHFGFIFPMLALRRRVIGVDFAPAPPSRGPLELEDLRDQALAVVDEVCPGRPFAVCGYSLGAEVAATVAAARPDLVQSAVLAGGWLQPDAHQRLRNSVWRTLRREGSDALLDYMAFCAFSSAYLAGRTPEELERVRRRFVLGELIDQHMRLAPTVDLTDVVADVTAPTLVVGASHDQMVPPRAVKRLFGAILGARYAEVASGHAMHTERPAELLRLIELFVSDPTRTPAGAVLPAIVA